MTTTMTGKNLKLKAMVEKFKHAHQKFCAALVQSAYRLTKDAAEIGNMLLNMQKEGRFNTKNKLLKWLKSEVDFEFPKTTFYRYINAAEWWKQAAIVSGKEALTDVASLKALKLLASPKVDFDPIDEGWAKKGNNYTQTIQGVHAEVRCDEGKKPYVWINGKCDCATGGLKEAIAIAEVSAARFAQQLSQADTEQKTLPDKPHTGPALSENDLAGSEAQDAVIEGGDIEDDPHDEETESLETAEKAATILQHTPQLPSDGKAAQPTINGTPQPTTYFHYDCHDFEIDGNSLHCLDQQGSRVILVAPKPQKMTPMLRKALNDVTGELTVEAVNKGLDERHPETKSAGGNIKAKPKTTKKLSKKVMVVK